jgi:multicomponent Na+:H+ antiporter subunit B
MGSVILQTTARALQPVMLLASVFLLLRGHNAPGGGFVGGLVAAAAFALRSIAFGVQNARRSALLEPRTVVGGGLLLAVASLVAPMAAGRPLATSVWFKLNLPVVGLVELGSPLLFDVGVYMVVAGVATMVFLALEEA